MTLDEKTLDPVLWTRTRWESAPLRMTFRASSRREAEAWQKKLRPKITELLGGFPSARGPLNAGTVEVKEFPGYKRERFVFTSRPGVEVAGYLLTPSEAKRPYRDHGLRPGTRPRRRRHRRHRRKGPRPHRQGGLSARFRHSSGGARHGCRRHRADCVRMPARSLTRRRVRARPRASPPPAPRSCSARR